MNRHKTIQHILKSYHTIAVVGFSSQLSKAGYYVPDYMQRHGYKIIPVNPYLESALGEPAYPTLRDIPQKVEVVQIFRRPQYVVPFVEEAIEIGAKAIWLQLDIINDEARKLAQEAGLHFVQNSCMLVEHRHLKQYEGSF